MINQTDIINYVHNYNEEHKADGFTVVSLFGSYARGENDIFSDIDLTYKIDHDKFYKDDAFSKLLKIEEIKKELEKKFHKKVDLVPVNNTNKFFQDTLKKEQIIIEKIEIS